MTDIEHATYYEDLADGENLSAKLKAAGLHNLGELILSLFTQLAEKDAELEELGACEDEAYHELRGGIAAFQNYFNNSEEDLITRRTIRGKEFAILLGSDLDALKQKFHQYLD